MFFWETLKKRKIHSSFCEQKGITLIALVITIIVLLILAGVTIATLTGDNGILTKAAEASFRQEMSEIRDKIDLYTIENQINADKELSFKEIKIEDTKSWRDTLKQEIVLWGNYNVDVNEVTTAYIKNNFEKLANDNRTALNIYYIEENNSKNKYIYNEKTDIVYKINPTKIGKYTVHSIEELDYLKNGGVREKSINAKNYTKIEYEAEFRTIDGVSYYEPDLNGIAKEATSLVFYKQENGQIVENEKVITAEKWLEDGRPNQIQDDTGTYILYNYKEKIWANIRIESSSLTTNWVWIPRYCYKNTDTVTDVKFLRTTDKSPEEYELAGSFVNNQDKGTFISKYEPSSKVQTDTSYYPYYIPDISQFDKENTYIEIYNKETNVFEKEVKASTIANLNSFSKQNLWFDYEKQIWANIKVVKNDLETWWVWIPRYAYNASGTTTDTDIIFIGTDNKPIDGSELPSGYEIAGSFKNNKDKGIWISKYEPSATVQTQKQNIEASTIDVSNFDKKSTNMVFYKINNGQVTEETKTLTVEEWEKKGRPSEIKSLFTTYVLFDYKNNIWANIKVEKNDGVTWWTWIPRYAYNESGTTTDTDVIFITTDNKQLNGSELPSGYSVAGSFINNQNLGIWVSKYEPSSN